jgi:hypothetical protein
VISSIDALRDATNTLQQANAILRQEIQFTGINRKELVEDQMGVRTL